eukprot:8989865-Pyramimonas_sp.AAC.1
MRKLKRRKAPGPDDLPTEVYKELTEQTLDPIRALLNDRWDTEHIPPDVLEARVIVICKKRRHEQSGQLQTDIFLEYHLQHMRVANTKTVGD